MIKVYNCDLNLFKGNSYGQLPQACIKLYEGLYEISIAIQDGNKFDIKVFNRPTDNECTQLFFKSEIKKHGIVIFSNDKLIKAIRIARKLSK